MTGDAVKLQELDGLFSFEQVKSGLRLSYAQTYASVQGTEFTAQLRLWDTGHHFSPSGICSLGYPEAEPPET